MRTKADRDVETLSPEELFELWWNERLTRIPVRFREDSFWDTETAALVSGKKPVTIRAAAKRGHIQHTRSGVHIFVLKSSLKAWLRRLFMRDE